MIDGLDYETFPKTEEGWIEALCADDDGTWGCIPSFLLPYARFRGLFNEKGTPLRTNLLFDTPFAHAKFLYSGDQEAPHPPWRETGMSPRQYERQTRKARTRELNRKAGPVVYFIGGESGPIKIGISGGPNSRLAALQIGSPIPLRIMATISGDLEMELAYHTRFASCRLHGEWFERTPELMAEIARLNSLCG